MEYLLDNAVTARIGTEKYKCTVEWRNGRFIVDEPEKAGGKDEGPDPYTLLLSLLGIYGVLAYAVAQRTREIAIRMALGASPKVVLLRTLRFALTVTATGVACGLIASIGLMHFLTSLLYGVKPLDGMTIAGAVLVLLCCSALAALIPAQRAAAIDPMRALRAE